MVNRFGQDLIGEAMEIGQSIKKQAKQVSPGKIVKTAMEQVSGDSSSSDIPPGLEDLQGKKATPKQLAKMKQDDNTKQSQKISNTRAALKGMVIQRYKKMQQEVLTAEQKREQDKVETSQEELEEWKELQAEEEKKQSGSVPKRRKGKGLLGIGTKQKKGTRELGKTKVG
ncbi:hypothetical protein ACFLZ1_01725 [Patescibacteria group bacterium]